MRAIIPIILIAVVVLLVVVIFLTFHSDSPSSSDVPSSSSVPMTGTNVSPIPSSIPSSLSTNLLMSLHAGQKFYQFNIPNNKLSNVDISVPNKAELRGLAKYNGGLLFTNAYKKSTDIYSASLSINGSGAITITNIAPFIANNNNILSHTYGLAVCGNNIFASNQDGPNTIVWSSITTSPDFSRYWSAPGSSQTIGVPTSVSPRGMLCIDGLLYCCMEGMNSIIVFSPSSVSTSTSAPKYIINLNSTTLTPSSSAVPITPIGLAYQSGSGLLFVSTKAHGILVLSINTAGDYSYSHQISIPNYDHPAGMVFNGNTNLYVVYQKPPTLMMHTINQKNGQFISTKSLRTFSKKEVPEELLLI